MHCALTTVLWQQVNNNHTQMGKEPRGKGNGRGRKDHKGHHEDHDKDRGEGEERSERRGPDAEKVSKRLGKVGRGKRAYSILNVCAKDIKNKVRRKALVVRQKAETRKMRKFQHLKDQKLRLEHGEAVSFYGARPPDRRSQSSRRGR